MGNTHYGTEQWIKEQLQVPLEHSLTKRLANDRDLDKELIHLFSQSGNENTSNCMYRLVMHVQ